MEWKCLSTLFRYLKLMRIRMFIQFMIRFTTAEIQTHEIAIFFIWLIKTHLNPTEKFREIWNESSWIFQHIKHTRLRLISQKTIRVQCTRTNELTLCWNVPMRKKNDRVFIFAKRNETNRKSTHTVQIREPQLKRGDKVGAKSP